MHKDKVKEVHKWLETADQMLQLGLPPAKRLLILSGPPGTGKSAMLRVLAAEMGYETCEWVEPRTGGGSELPFEEDAMRADDAQRAEPRMASFATFLRNALRTLSLCIEPVGGVRSSSGMNPAPSYRRRLVILDELAPTTAPFLPGADGINASTPREQQIAIIRESLLSARFPIALVVSTDASSSVHHLVEQLRGPNARSQELVQEIKVNALADTLLTKVLKNVSNQEGLALSEAEIRSLVAQANGDLRNALHSMQFIAAGVSRRTGGVSKPAKDSTGPRTGTKRALSAAQGPGPSALVAACGSDRDHFPDMFHAIGAIIHRPAKRAKRFAEHRVATLEQEQNPPQDGSGASSRPACSTEAIVPADLDAGWSPEAVIESSALEAPSAACFLHQNYPESFLDIGELAESASCLSAANVLTDAQRRRPWQTALLPYVASLAGRGLVTNNQHPAPSSFNPTRKPLLFAIEREALERKGRAASAFGHRDPCGILDGFALGSTVLASEVLPAIRLIISRSGGQSHCLTQQQWQSVMEMTSYQSTGRTMSGSLAPLVYRPPLPPAPSRAGQPAPLEDEIEE